MKSGPTHLFVAALFLGPVIGPVSVPAVAQVGGIVERLALAVRLGQLLGFVEVANDVGDDHHHQLSAVLAIAFRFEKTADPGNIP